MQIVARHEAFLNFQPINQCAFVYCKKPLLLPTVEKLRKNQIVNQIYQEISSSSYHVIACS